MGTLSVSLCIVLPLCAVSHAFSACGLFSFVLQTLRVSSYVLVFSPQVNPRSRALCVCVPLESASPGGRSMARLLLPELNAACMRKLEALHARGRQASARVEWVRDGARRPAVNEIQCSSANAAARAR